MLLRTPSATITMPDLMIRGGAAKKESIATLVRVAPTSRENLLAAGRPVITADPPSGPPKSISGAVRVSSAPDPRFEGRTVYTVALQMPNVTSYSDTTIQTGTQYYFAVTAYDLGGAESGASNEVSASR